TCVPAISQCQCSTCSDGYLLGADLVTCEETTDALHVTADDTLDAVWVDGVEQQLPMDTTPGDWKQESVVAFEGSWQVVALQFSNLGPTDTAVLASFESGLVTDGTWRCSSTPEAGWEATCFDDSGWSPAIALAANGSEPWVGEPALPVAGISESAYWIGAVELGEGVPDQTTVCRLVRDGGPVLDGYPCDDGDHCTQDDACALGACVGVAMACEDPGPCGVSTCGVDGGCVIESANEGVACDDLDVCTTDDRCHAGTCTGFGWTDIPGCHLGCVQEGTIKSTWSVSAELVRGVATTADRIFLALPGQGVVEFSVAGDGGVSEVITYPTTDDPQHNVRGLAIPENHQSIVLVATYTGGTVDVLDVAGSAPGGEPIPIAVDG
ncbi:MAG: hypothetical protein QF464_22605, partial [Myxococcota bacterium]|nr:hypothetical protein [Myxococcota bacterium]